jgi:guanylate kinase
MAKKLNIITGPTNTGKTDFMNFLLANFPEEFIRLITSTTRELRQNETAYDDYFKYDVPTFNQLITEDKLFEWEEVYEGDLYGCERSEWKRVSESGKTPIVALNTNGALKFMGEINTGFIDMTGIEINAFFITSPKEELIGRLMDANHNGLRNDSEKKIKERIAKIDFELSQAKFFKPENVVENKNGHFDVMANQLLTKILNS